MSFVEDAVKTAVDPFGVIEGKVLGGDAAEAAERASRQQQAAATEAIGFQRESRDLARADLAPFLQFGTNIMPQAESLLFDPAAQFQFLQDNPFFQQAVEEGRQDVLNLASSRGRTTAGDTREALINNAILSGLPILQGQQQNLLNALGIGQSSAAGQAATTMQAAPIIGDLITGRGAAKAAGTIGAENARTQGFQNLLNIGATAFGMPGGIPGLTSASSPGQQPNFMGGANLFGTQFQ